MDAAVSSVQKLISSAFQRCRVSDEMCRISVALQASLYPPATRISISDTGIACSLEEFQHLKLVAGLSQKWDGMLSVRTTGMCDEEIFNHEFNLKESGSSLCLNNLPSIPKNGMKFSGTDVCLAVLEKLEVILFEIRHFIQKMLILNIPNVGFELLVNHEDASVPCYKHDLFPIESNSSPFLTSGVERLKCGFEDYILKQRQNRSGNSSSDFNTLQHLKSGFGTDSSPQSLRRPELVMEAVITISEFSDQTNPYLMECDRRTEILYFKDFCPSPISKSSLNGLLKTDWKSYGLTLAGIVEHGGSVFLEWEHLPPNACIDVVFHCYQKKEPCPVARQKSYSNQTLLNKAAKLALDDLKEKHRGFLLSDHARKIQGYAPDLARTLAGLIHSSNDAEFQTECLSLLGLPPEKVGTGNVEDCIKDKIVFVIEQNDRKPERCKDAAPFLFEQAYPQELDFDEEDRDESLGSFNT